MNLYSVNDLSLDCYLDEDENVFKITPAYRANV